MWKFLKFLFAVIGAAVVALVVFLVITYFSSDKLVCKSNEGDITIMYKNGKISGYTAINIDYNLSEQQQVAEDIGIDEYLKQFDLWFRSNTTGTCEDKK